MKHTLGQLIRYGTVGTISNAVGFLLYLLLTHLGMGPKGAMSLLYVVGVLQTFYFNRRWSFRFEGAGANAFARYCMSYGAGYLLNFFGLWLFVDYYRLPHAPVEGVLIFVVASMLFLLQKFWVFPHPSPINVSGASS